MNSIDSLANYVEHLSLAEVTLSNNGSNRITFNGLSSTARLESQLILDETRCAHYFNYIRSIIKADENVKFIVKKRIARVEKLFLENECIGDTHVHLHIEKDNQTLTLEELIPEIQQNIAKFIRIQLNSLEQTRELLLRTKRSVQSDITLNLSTSELLEITLSLIASEKFASSQDPIPTVACVRFMAEALQLEFPCNYDTKLKNLFDREKPTMFLDHLKKQYLTFLHEQKGRADISTHTLP